MAEAAQSKKSDSAESSKKWRLRTIISASIILLPCFSLPLPYPSSSKSTGVFAENCTINNNCRVSCLTKERIVNEQVKGEL